tara:strand:+ start:329 stop:1108 length:780 start_codon:yes stop_codon:yes gene_type:complete
MTALHPKNWLISALVAVGVLTFSQPSAQAKDLLVFAAASLALPLQEIADSFTTKTRHRVRISLAGSATLAHQIAKGAPADIYLSANQIWMDYLTKKLPLVASSRQHLLSNRLVLVAPAKAIQPVGSLTRLTLSKILQKGRLAIGDPDHVPAGIYAVQALKRLDLWPAAKDKLARMNNVRAALAMVERGATPAGIVYQTDAFKNSKVSVIYRFPAASHEKISYWAARVRHKNGAATQALFEFLLSPAAKAVFKRHGFLVN